MDTVLLLPRDSLGRNFIPPEFLPTGADEYYLRNKQLSNISQQWRSLCPDEVEELIRNNNFADDWSTVFVTDPFNPQSIKNARFFGLVRLGRFTNSILDHHGFQIPVGITNSTIVSCDIGNDSAIHNVHYLAHYIIGNRCVLVNIDEMLTTNTAKFGNGIVKDGESENVRIWLDVVNENSTRRVLPFDGIIPADAYLWMRYRDDSELLRQFLKMVQKQFDSKRGYYGTIGDQCVIKSCKLVKDVRVGSHCYIEGANTLKNLTINSSEDEPTYIGEGVILVNGIIGYGCRIFYNSIADRFVMGNNSTLKYGARLIHTFLGDNSTISCCEVLNNLIFPAHEQHHNNSFLIATHMMGQSNIAAGATIGSNHNSRANDNEIVAGRGFWAGLCTSLKHSSRFASFTLLSKADYPNELNIILPFSLLNNNYTLDRLEVLPAFWWLYNMYALVRNTWKFQARDKRKRKIQNIEYDFLAPDTVEEILYARYLLELWTAKAYCLKHNESFDTMMEEERIALGKDLFSRSQKEIDTLEVLGEMMERSNRKVVILKAFKAYHAYTDMLYYYAMKNIIQFLTNAPTERFTTLHKHLAGERVISWVNLGGQIVPEYCVDELRANVREGKITTWDDIHQRYNELWKKYPLEKQKHAYAVFCLLHNTPSPTENHWHDALTRVATIQKFICEQVYLSRKKDYNNYFRQITYRNYDEMYAAGGSIESNELIQQVERETEEFIELLKEMEHRI
ncbi:MAG: DUF4954 family protein [Bacteroidetes bacterium]|nr:DUF4954 family protein [Bacteroidota bacterium]